MPNSESCLFITSTMDLKGETGVQTHVGNFIDYVASRGEQYSYIGPDQCHDLRLARRIVLWIVRRVLKRINSSAIWYMLRQVDQWAFRREFQNKLRNSDAWCVYAQDPVTASAALSQRKYPKQRVVLIVHFNVSQAEEMVQRGRLVRASWVYRRILRDETAVLSQVDGLVFPSDFMLRAVSERCDVDQRGLVIPNTCPVPPEKHSTPQGDLIAIGTLEQRKNQQFLLRVLSEAKLRGHEYTLTLVGGGEDREYLVRLATELGIDRQVRFVGRIENASSLISSYKLLVHSALVENMPITLIESLAAGVPILAPRVGGIPEIFEDGVEGHFWPLDNVSDAASLMIRLLEDGPRMKRMSRAAQERYEQCFSYDRIHARLLSFIRGGAELPRLTNVDQPINSCAPQRG